MKTLCSLKFKIWIVTGLLMAAPFCFAVDTSVPIPKVDPLIPPITQPNYYPTINPIGSSFSGIELLIDFN
jgi:hypothetical protein